MNTPDEDFKHRHYKPAGLTFVCGAGKRVLDRIGAGVEKTKHAILKVPGTTDVRKVSCRMCQHWIRSVVDQYH